MASESDKVAVKSAILGSLKRLDSTTSSGSDPVDRAVKRVACGKRRCKPVAGDRSDRASIGDVVRSAIQHGTWTR